jgi:tripartite-type tricarboxylate transporter receptor subunit TctC
LNAALNNATKNPKLKEILESRGADVYQGTPEDFTNFIKAEIAKFAPVIRRAGVVVE